MEDWLYYLLFFTFSLSLHLLLRSLLRPITGKLTAAARLPPGSSALSVIIGPLFLGRSNFAFKPIIGAARSWYGPVFTLYPLPSRPAIIVADRAVAHHALVQCGTAFADRPPANLAARIFSSDQRNITSGAYGRLWSVLRRNLTGKILHPSCGLADGVVESVMAVQREFSTSALGFQVLGVCPAVTKLVFRRRWRQILSLRRRQEELYLPLIRACAAAGARRDVAGEGVAVSYVDSLLALRIPEDGIRNLTEGEMVSLCSEFFVAGTESTAAVAQWIMANLVARPEIQAKLREEIRAVAGDDGVGAGSVQEDHLPRMPHLRAVVLEALRLHPPGHFVLPHEAVTAATEEDDAAAFIDGFQVPRHTTVNFTVSDMGRDKTTWPDAARFLPEWFLPGGEGADVDLTGGREIKMIPFGTGRRAFPGVALALLHLESLVANLVAEFEWREVAGEAVDLAEKQEISVVMRRPVRATVVPCRRNMHGERNGIGGNGRNGFWGFQLNVTASIDFKIHATCDSLSHLGSAVAPYGTVEAASFGGPSGRVRDGDTASARRPKPSTLPMEGWLGLSCFEWPARMGAAVRGGAATAGKMERLDAVVRR
ncbi:hypothetical protein E2562_031580 [Oryza meyeriana var. granulata]|uniref:Cytochrome P450 n=1 Tax=Oryza meyeriana var. granulata TaxID=110450 RepID=A0A6G1CK08_9ORYZ|nr:hypothetical protein E2562_031580 [Oryza meyeriana var. granulata]